MPNTTSGNGIDGFSYNPTTTVAETASEQKSVELTIKGKCFSQSAVESI